MATPTPRDRLIEIDALRGIAALLVVLFHYTTRFDEIYVHVAPPVVAVPWGYLGVNLFFMISGFVIFMTLDRTRHPLDFVVSRFSRLYPAYWVAVLLTFTTLLIVELPGKSTGWFDALANLLMFHNLFGAKHVDSVYWTLEVELLFYALMLTLWSAGLLRRPFLVIGVWLGLRLLYVVASRAAGIDLPYVVSRMLILEFFPYFAIGMAIYLRVTRPSTQRWKEPVTVVASLALIALADGALQVFVSVLLAALLYGAASKRMAALRWSPLVWLGAISYPLYLLHENIGWAVLLQLELAGWNTHLAIAATIALALGLSAALHYGVEMPAMQAIRRRFRAKRGPSGAVPVPYSAVAWSASVAVGLIVVVAVGRWVSNGPAIALPGSANIAEVQPVRGDTVPCNPDSEPDPLVLLVLGQSNAGNHGEAGGSLQSPTRVFAGGRCVDVVDPLPGATGTGGSIWSRLAERIEQDIAPRRVVVAAFAVDATAMATWTEPGPLRDMFDARLAEIRASGLQPAAVLWQQGESDARLGTAADAYLKGLLKLADRLREYGIRAPLYVAHSTVCRGDGSGMLRRALVRMPDRDAGFEQGANTDGLAAEFRTDGCHFNRAGLDKAADLWYDVLRARAVFATSPTSSHGMR